MMNEQFASFRNVLDLTLAISAPEALRICGGLDEAKSKLNQGRGIDKVCCPLPFSLQDLCLLVIVSDLNALNTHQIELLASLPRWLRKRLLNVLPAVDLGRLEHTPVADGVDIDSIWISKWKQKAAHASPGKPLSFQGLLLARSSGYSGTETRKNFQLNVCTNDAHLIDEIRLALKDVDHSKFPKGKECLFTLASDILTKYPEIDMNAVIHKLISIEGELVFSNLLSGSLHVPCKTSLCGQRVWMKQDTGLAVNVKSLENYSIHSLPMRQYYASPFRGLKRLQYARTSGVNLDNTHLTPHRLLPILYKYNPLEVLSLLNQDCSIQPFSAYFHIDSISKPFLLNMSSEKLALDNGSSIPSDSCTSIMHRFVHKVIVLGLRCDSYCHIGVMVSMIEGATLQQENSPLKNLFCIMPNLFTDIVKPLSSVFSLPNFCHLTLQVDEIYPQSLCKLLQEFMTTPSSSTHKLAIYSKKGILLPSSLKESQLATLKGDTHISSPSCNPEHKVLQLSSQKEFTHVLQLLLQLPTIRLKEIVLVKLDEYYDYVHFCAVHPDLQTTKLVIDLSEIRGFKFSALQADLISLFQMPSLQKISISGDWGKYEEIKIGLVQGLQRRIHLPPLTKLFLILETNNSYKMRDFQILCDAIFSLPRLDNFKLVLGKGFGDMLRQPSFEKTMYQSWRHRASRVQLKSICVSGYNPKSVYLPLIAKECSISTKHRVQRERKRYYDYDFDLFADDDYGYYDNPYEYEPDDDEHYVYDDPYEYYDDY